MFKNYRIFLIVGLFIFLVFIGIQIPWGSSVDRFIVNHLEIDEVDIPRTDGGRVDFIRIVDDMTALPAEENVLAGVVEVLGTDFDSGSVNERRFFEDLGINPKGVFIEEVTDYLKQDGMDYSAVLDIADNLYSPWREEEFPDAYRWLQKNNTLIDQLVRAADRTGILPSV